MRTPGFLACTIVLLAIPPARADRPAIEKALADMSHAAAAADVDAYLANVSSTDPTFYKEQCNWAKDLKRIKPEAVEFTIGEVPKADDKGEKFDDRNARFEMVTTWTIPPVKEGRGGGKPIERSVSFPVNFELSFDGKWLYAGEDWLTMQSAEPPPRDERFQGVDPESKRGVNGAANHRQRGARVKYFPGFELVAERIVNIIPIVRDHVDEGFQNEVPRIQEVKLYPSMKHLQESIYLSYTDGLSGWNEPGEAIKLLTRPTSGSRGLRSLLAHEYGHVATFELGPKSNDMPWWILEGVAELSAERFVGKGDGRDAEATVVRWYNDDKLADWKELADFHTVPGSLQHNVYKQGQHMMMYISDNFRPEGRNAWMRAMSNGKTLDEATQEVMHMSFDDLDAKWRDAVKALAEKAAAEKATKDKSAN